MNTHALIFGACGGIGRALVEHLLREGWRVSAVSRSAERLETLPDAVTTHVADATEPGAAARVFAEAGAVDAVVNCIGNLYLKPLSRSSDADYDNVLRTHVYSSFAILREAATRLNPGGSAALLSSAAARTGLPNHELIAAAKGALEGLVRSTAATWAPKGLRINAVAPGLTETPMTSALTAAATRAVSEKMHALGRLGKPEDIARALAWLIHTDQSWISGEILHVDGGLAHLRSLPR